MKSLKKTIMLLLAIMIIAVLILIVLLFLRNNSKQEEVIEEEADYTRTIEEDLEKVKDYNSYYSIINTMATYYAYVTNGNGTALSSVIDSEYMSKNSITKDNIAEKMGEQIDEQLKNNENFEVKVQKMYVKDNYEYPTYCVHGKIYYYDANDQMRYNDCYIIVYTDSENITYSIEPITETEYKSIEQNKTELANKKIEQNQYNKMLYINVSEETAASSLLYDFKLKAETDVESAYNLIDKEYREKRFGNIDEFKKYIENSSIKNAMQNKYQRTVKDDYTEYVCIDQNNNYYIFKENGILDYTVILDTYTLDLPEVVSNYNSSTEEEKITINIQKVFQALNSGDYKYVYGKLDDTFKSTNFKTEADFEKYVKENLYKNNKIAYRTKNKTGDVYIYSLIISDGNGVNEKDINKDIIMQLKEGTDFVMSFNIK